MAIMLLISSRVPGSVPMPGPRAKAALFAKSAIMSSKAAASRPPDGVWASAVVMGSMTMGSMTGISFSGTPKVTRPAPVRMAALAHNAAAPVLPGEPASISR